MERTLKTDTRRYYKERVLRVLVHIQQHLDEELSLEDLARLAHFSPYHFHRIFRGMVGESLKAHVRRLRLERAAQKLKGAAPVAAIAEEASYDSPEAFTRAFKSMFSRTPSRFREERQSLSYPYAPSGVHYDHQGSINHFDPFETEGSVMEVTTENLEPRRVAFMRHIGPYQEVGNTWTQMMMWAGPRGLVGPQASAIGVCHDDPEVTPAAKIRYDACVPVGEDFEGEGEVGVQTLAGGSYAKATHKGPYEKLGDSYARLLGEELPKQGLEPRSAPCLEIYLNDPRSTAPEELLTAIYVPVSDSSSE